MVDDITYVTDGGLPSNNLYFIGDDHKSITLA